MIGTPKPVHQVSEEYYEEVAADYDKNNFFSNDPNY